MREFERTTSLCQYHYFQEDSSLKYEGQRKGAKKLRMDETSRLRKKILTFVKETMMDGCRIRFKILLPYYFWRFRKEYIYIFYLFPEMKYFWYYGTYWIISKRREKYMPRFVLEMQSLYFLNKRDRVSYPLRSFFSCFFFYNLF